MREFYIYIAASVPYTFEEKLKMIKDAGFDGICLNWEAELYKNPAERIKEPTAVFKSGLKIENAHLTGEGTNLLWKDDAAYAREVTNRYCGEIDMLAEAGVNTGVIHCTWGLDTPPLSSEGLKYFEEIFACAEMKKVKIAIENSVSWRHLDLILSSTDSEYIGFCYDSGHHNLFAPNEKLTDKHLNRLCALHLNDNDGKRDLHILPFDGNIDWEKTVQILSGSEYFLNKITIEPGFSEKGNYLNTDYKTFLEKAYQSVLKIDKIITEMTV